MQQRVVWHAGSGLAVKSWESASIVSVVSCMHLMQEAGEVAVTGKKFLDVSDTEDLPAGTSSRVPPRRTAGSATSLARGVFGGA